MISSFVSFDSPSPVISKYIKYTYQEEVRHLSQTRKANLFVCRLINFSSSEIDQLEKLAQRNTCISVLRTRSTAVVILTAPKAHFFKNLSRLIDFSSFFEREFLNASKDTLRNFHIQDGPTDPNRPLIMGIMNITPDSFYDGGKLMNVKNIQTVAEQMIEAGADILDVGGESTRPGSEPVSYQEELVRVIPVIESIREKFEIPISIDTTKPIVAEAAIKAGANLINDTSFLKSDEKMLEVLRETGASYCLMHAQGTPKTMQNNPSYEDLIFDVLDSLERALERLKKAGVEQKKICIDLGIGFGKSLEQNTFLLNFLESFRQLGYPLLVGTSNKSFMGKLMGLELNNRLFASVSSQVHAYMKGASLFRVHNIKECAQALRFVNSLES